MAGIISAEERVFLETATGLIYSNPFLPEWIERERLVLGGDFIDEGPVWSMTDPGSERRANLLRIDRRMADMADGLRRRIESGGGLPDEDRALYEDVVLLMLYQRYSERFLKMALEALEPGGAGRCRADFYDEFAALARHYLAPSVASAAVIEELPHIFAIFFQIRRAFHHIYSFIVGQSLPAARLRAAAWQSVFTHDMRRYRRGLYRQMGEITTLITGPSGSGKELVARAVGLARYLPFDLRTRSFAAGPGGAFHALDLSALSPTLIESELFGHRKGAFTGAQADHPGWLEVCPPEGAVFLDEIGELAVSLQVKLLRVLETRTFQRLGETAPRRFQGKVIVATNRDLEREISAGRFRADLYYRLCSDVIATPSLRERLADSPGELHNLVLHIARGAAGEGEAENLAAEVEAYIAGHLGADYAWPGNIRELAQCVRNVLVRKEYRPARLERLDVREHFLAEVAAGRLSAGELLGRYAALVHSRTGSYEETARLLDLDRRTVRARMDREMLAELGGG
ncbi:MAG TPA: sigma 54-interacting transcriptional regulator [Planctomycetota bacterium]|nr:sigma 54-interacting transcriptional regulator [Planctomycetota bacterium]